MIFSSQKKKKTSVFIRLQIEVVISTMKRKNHVHDHIVLDILARLPVKSIIKFRCVCKAWYSSITEPYFIFTHVRALASGNLNSTLFYHSKMLLYHYNISFYNTSTSQTFISLFYSLK